jgi:vancomycin resistance protein YoaR
MKTRILGVVPLLLVLALVSSVLAFELYHANRIYPGVWVWGVDVSAMDLDEGATALEEGIGHEKPLITLLGPERSWEVRPADLGLQIHTGATLAPAYALGRDDSLTGSLVAQLRLLFDSATFPPIAVYDENTARRYLGALAEEAYVPATNASLSFDGTKPVANPSYTGRYLDVDATLAALSPAVMTLAPAEVVLVLREIHPTVVDATAAQAEAEALLAGPLTLSLAEPREGDSGSWVIPPEQMVTLLTVQEQNGVLHVALDKDALRAYLETLAPAIAIEPIDARYDYDPETRQLEAISASAEGRLLDVEASTVRILTDVPAGSRHVPLIVHATIPLYPDTATAEGIGVTDLVAEGESYFIGSPTGRDHNIRLAASKFHGIVIEPGETFSFNYYLGPVTAEEGYDESFITAGEQLQMGIGGGICQVSTTMFRAAFWGGYPITERWYHYQRVGYYELRGGGVGMDATVYSPQVDLKFVNDRPSPILIQAEVAESSHRLTFRFYSTDDGRRVEMEGPEVTDELEPGPPIYELDDEMKPGTVEKWQSAVGGLTAIVERKVYDKDGNLLRHDTFVSKYAPRRAAYHYGPGYEPPAE